MANSIYLALGDSITSGYGVGAKNSFPALYYTSLAQNFPGLVYANLGVNGLTSRSLAYMLRTAGVRSLLFRSGIISITIASNDLLAVGKGLLAGRPGNVEQSLVCLADQLQSVGTAIRSINAAALVKVATLYNPLPAGPYQQYAASAQQVINQANWVIVHWAESFRFTVVPVGLAFKGKESLLIGPDYIHPNLAGHRLIGQLFAAGEF